MHIKTVNMENWVCFAGQNEVQLEPKAYAVVGGRVGKDGSSNWAGKTSFVEAIRFALYGAHRYRTEDEWITYSKPRGCVSLTLSDGTIITRSRARGKRTELLYVCGDVRLMQADAQQEIGCIFGADLSAFNSTSFFEQKNMSRLINASTEERMKSVSAWVDLSVLEDGEATLRAKYKAASATTQQLIGALSHIESSIARAGEVFMSEAHRASLEKELATFSALVDLEYRAKIDRESAQARAAKLTEELTSIRAQGETEKARLAQAKTATLPVITVPVAELTGQFAVLREELIKRRHLQISGFDGLCPVAKAPCPSAAFVNQRAAECGDAAKKAEEAMAPVEKALAAARLAEHTIKDHEETVVRLTRNLDTLRKDFIKKTEELKLATPGQDVDEDQAQRLAQAKEHIAELNAALSAAKHTEEHVQSLHRDFAEKETALVESRAEARALQVSLEIIGKNGLQRILAEQTMSKIAQDASNTLRTAGIDLGLGISWAREGSGKASSCSVCGSAFPASVKVTKCECGAERGANVIQRVEIVLSDRSGAAEDLAGIALQLSAAKHMKTTRGTGADFCVLDEPFGALDAHNRAGLSKALPSILRQAGMEQSFIIAHSPDVMEFLPGRIEILASGEGSTLKVVA